MAQVQRKFSHAPYNSLQISQDKEKARHLSLIDKDSYTRWGNFFKISIFDTNNINTCPLSLSSCFNGILKKFEPGAFSTA